jgi:hypothetical protein
MFAPAHFLLLLLLLRVLLLLLFTDWTGAGICCG